MQDQVIELWPRTASAIKVGTLPDLDLTNTSCCSWTIPCCGLGDAAAQEFSP